MAAYFEALTGIPAWAVSDAVNQILRGQTDIDARFAPTPSQLARTARGIMAPLVGDVERLKRIVVASGGDVEPSADERERVLDGFAKLREELRSAIKPMPGAEP